MNASDVILNLVDKLIAEKEKNFLLQLQQYEQQNQQQKVQDENLTKTNK